MEETDGLGGHHGARGLWAELAGREADCCVAVESGVKPRRDASWKEELEPQAEDSGL